MKRLIISLVGFGLLTNGNALTTVEVVARAKPCVVILKLWNSAHPETNSQGTGFFIARDKIMTANHVVAGDYDEILVTDLAGNNIRVASDPTYNNSDQSVDIAILQVTGGADHPFLSFASALPLEGQNVIAIGNPQGLTGTVSTGIVSAVRDNGNLIQFTAPVSNGSSGCPVLNEDAEVVGIADWIQKPLGNEIAQNLNFAHRVPVMQLAEANQGNASSWTAPSAPSVAQNTIVNFPGITKADYEACEGKPIPYAIGYAEVVAKVGKASLPELEQNWDALWPGAVIYKNANGRHVEFFYLGKHAGSLRPAKNYEELVAALEEVLGTSDVEHTTDGARIKRIYDGQYYKTKDDQYRAYQYASQVVIGTKEFMKVFEKQVADAFPKLQVYKGDPPKQQAGALAPGHPCSPDKSFST